MLGIHQTFLDFAVVESDNPKTLIFLDTSSYMEPPERPLLEVTLPGYDKYLLVNYTAQNVNTFNSGTLGLNRAFSYADLIDLPDGIWNVKQKICPYDYVYRVKKFVRVTNLRCKLGKVYQNIDLTKCSTINTTAIENELIKINSLIQGAILVVDKDSARAYNDYQTANKMVDSLLNRFCKNCI